jgi:hypothetical protein
MNSLRPRSRLENSNSRSMMKSRLSETGSIQPKRSQILPLYSHNKSIGANIEYNDFFDAKKQNTDSNHEEIFKQLASRIKTHIVGTEEQLKAVSILELLKKYFLYK